MKCEGYYRHCYHKGYNTGVRKERKRLDIYQMGFNDGLKEKLKGGKNGK